MSVNILRLAQGENISDTLSTSIGLTDTTIPVSTISKWSTNGGCVIIDRGTSNEEIIVCTGTGGSSLTVATGGRGFDGTTAVGHNAGATIESVPLAKDWNDMVNTLLNLFKVADGNIDITKIGGALYVVDTGAANAYVATLSPILASYGVGTIVAFKAANTNTGASTLNVNGLGAKNINKGSGASVLVAGDIISGQICICQYDGTEFQLLNPGTSQSAATATVTGLVPTPPNDTTKFLRGDATWVNPISVNVQDNTTNSTLTNPVVKTGWGYLLVASGGSSGSKAITFPTAFSTGVKSVIVNIIGVKLTSAPTLITDFTTSISGIGLTEAFGADSITTSGFNVSLKASGNSGADTYYGFSWIAYGD